MFNGRIKSIEYLDQREGATQEWKPINGAFDLKFRYRRRIKAITSSRANTSSVVYDAPFYPEIRGHAIDGIIYTHDPFAGLELADLTPFFGYDETDELGYSQFYYEITFIRFPKMRWTFEDWERRVWAIQAKYAIFCTQPGGGYTIESPITLKNDMPVNQIGFVIPIQSGLIEQLPQFEPSPISNFLSLNRIS